MRCLVTGANGFLGSHMVEFLKAKGHKIVKDSPEWMFHLAANHGGVGYISANEYDVAMDNMDLDYNAIAMAEDHGARLFYPSSSCIYPDNEGKPQGVYGYEKLLITELSKHAPFDMRVGILGTVFGPRQSQGEKSKFPMAIINKVIQGNPIEIWGDGQQVRTFLYVDDAVEMIYELMTTEYKGPVNIASEEQITVQEIADTLCEYAGEIPEYVYRNDKPSGAQERRENMAEWNKRYKYRPQVSTKEGFIKTYEWIRKTK